MADKTTLGARPVKVRHVKRSQSGTTVLGTVYAGDWDGLAGRGGFVSGTFERRLYEEGTGTLRLPNAAGSDGRLHRDRFACLTDPGYLPGDEWLEVYEDGDLVAVWTPTGRQSKRRQELQISGEDATTLLKRTREGTCGFWCASPRDVMVHYSRVWTSVIAEGFDSSGPALTYSTSPQTTGSWTYTRAQTDQVNYPGFARMSSGGPGARPDLSATGIAYNSMYLTWRLDVEVVPETLVAGDYIRVGLYSAGGGWKPVMDVYYDKVIFDTSTYGLAASQALATPLSAGVPLKLSIEYRPDRWLYFSVNGTIAHAVYGIFDAADFYPRVSGDGMANGSAVRVGSVTLRSLSPLPGSIPLATNTPAIDGDKHLPGSPPPGGLWGDYYNNGDNIAKYGAAAAAMVTFSPLQSPVAQRLDQTINFDATPPTWRPPGVPAGGFAVRWTGSVYLDLDNYDYGFRVTTGNAAGYDEIKLTIPSGAGSTGYAGGGGTATLTNWVNAQTAVGSPPTGTLRWMGPSGWYPIIVTFAHEDPAARAQAKLEWTRSDAVGTWAVVPSNMLSPYGIYRDQVRNESHYDAFKNVADLFGYQWTCEPRSLESGQFPGRIIPKARYGHDTEKVLDEPETVDIQADIDVDSRADSIQADASGLADTTGASQLTAEGNDLPAFSQHLYIGQSYESLSDITALKLLEQRLATLLTLRSAVWEEVSARPPGRRELLDSFPLTGALAEFAWAPGDGLRLNFPTVGVVDAIPRQILGVAREFVPDGMRPPSASFRPRPRSVRALLREIHRAALVPQRNYQQQVVALAGSTGGTGGVDAFTRITLPTDLTTVVRVDLVVLYKSDASAWWVEANLVNPNTISVIASGRYDVTSLMLSSPGGYNFARLVTTGASTGTWTIQLVATVRV